MEPINDLFEQQVRSIYEGYEVPAPASTRDAVFNELDSSKSGSFVSKSLLIAASVLTVGAIYMMSDQPTQTEEGVEPTSQIEQVVEAPEVLIEETAIEEVVEIVEVKEPITIEQVVDPVVVVVQEAEIFEEVVVAEEPEVVVEEIKEVAQPVVLVETETSVVKGQEVEEKKEEVEWLLPAKIKVEK